MHKLIYLQQLMATSSSDAMSTGIAVLATHTKATEIKGKGYTFCSPSKLTPIKVVNDRYYFDLNVKHDPHTENVFTNYNHRHTC